MTNDGPATPAAPAPVRAEGQRSRRFGKLLVVVLAFLVALAAVAGGALLFLYDRATGIDRSTPQVVTRQFLDATLVLKDNSRTSLFVCSGWSADEAMSAIAAPTDSGAIATWGSLDARVVGATATVSTRVTFRFPDSRRQVEIWTLELLDESGWRVCGVTKESSL